MPRRTAAIQVLYDEDTEVWIEFDYTPEVRPSGLSGPPEYYDPGAPAEDFRLRSVSGATAAESLNFWAETWLNAPENRDDILTAIADWEDQS